MVPPDPLSPSPSTFPDVKSIENMEEAPDDLEPAAAVGIKVEYCSDYLYSPRTGAVTKVTCQNVSQYRYYLIIWNT